MHIYKTASVLQCNPGIWYGWCCVVSSIWVHHPFLLRLTLLLSSTCSVQIYPVSVTYLVLGVDSYGYDNDCILLFLSCCCLVSSCCWLPWLHTCLVPCLSCTIGENFSGDKGSFSLTLSHFIHLFCKIINNSKSRNCPLVKCFFLFYWGVNVLSVSVRRCARILQHFWGRLDYMNT